MSIKVDDVVGVHATTSNTLYLMCHEDQKEDRYSMVPLNRLKIPCFSGELSRVFLNEQDNYYRTFFSQPTPRMYSYSRNLEMVQFDFDKVKDSCLKFIDKKDFKFDCRELCEWRKFCFEVRRLRTWDEARFQKDCGDIVADFLQKVPAALEQAPKSKWEGFTPQEERAELKTALENLSASLKAPCPGAFNDQDRKRMNSPYPIMLLTNKPMAQNRWGELVTTKNMKLGEEIPWIATDEDHVQELQDFVKLQGLSDKVTVVSLKMLDQTFNYKKE